MGRAGIFWLAAALLLATPALAEDRSVAQRQTLSDLAYTLGESHGVRQACFGAADQFWRSRMERLIEVEAAEQAFTARISRAFNAGYAAAQAGFPACDGRARAEAGRLAAKGKRLAAALAR
ncbi:MAG: TIGR02301 family protein [Caulobacteraceae bacterium]